MSHLATAHPGRPDASAPVAPTRQLVLAPLDFEGIVDARKDLACTIATHLSRWPQSSQDDYFLRWLREFALLDEAYRQRAHRGW